MAFRNISKVVKSKLGIPALNHCINFQAVFNVFGMVCMLLSSVGILTCLKEIENIKKSTDFVVDSFSIYKNKSFRVKTINEKMRVLNTQKDAFIKRVLRKRSADSNEGLWTDHSAEDTKDTEDYCWSLIYNRCGGSSPGAPGIGPPGPPGPPGERGLPGRDGRVGHMGPPGVNGHKGQKGEKGRFGQIGHIGTDGPRGPPGVVGNDGLRGPSGRRGKRGMPGKPGKPGNVGFRGLHGQKGQKGDKGDRGGAVLGPGGNCTCKGIKGDKGQRGLVGFDGYKGEKGEPGKKGEKGYGMMGYKGAKGELGDKGEKGDSAFCTVNCGDKYVRRKADDPRQRLYSKGASIANQKSAAFSIGCPVALLTSLLVLLTTVDGIQML